MKIIQTIRIQKIAGADYNISPTMGTGKSKRPQSVCLTQGDNFPDNADDIKKRFLKKKKKKKKKH